MAVIVQDKRIARIEGPGLVLVCTDLHGHREDFANVQAVFARLWARSREDARPVLVITGDLFHGPPQDKRSWFMSGFRPYVDQSPRLFRELMSLLQAYRGHVVVLMGNHDHAHVGGPKTSKFHSDEAAHFEAQLVDREIQRLHRFLETLPLVALTDGDVVLTHAAAPSGEVTVEDLRGLSYAGFSDLYPIDFMRRHALGELLWRRSAPVRETLTFVRAMTGQDQGIHIHGHNIAPRGYRWDSEHELCISSSFGAEATHKSVVLLSNQARYRNAQVATEREIVHRTRELLERL